MYDQRVKIEIEDCQTHLVTTISFLVSPENLECMMLPIGEILREGKRFAKQTNRTGARTASCSI